MRKTVTVDVTVLVALQVDEVGDEGLLAVREGVELEETAALLDERVELVALADERVEVTMPEDAVEDGFVLVV